MGISFRKATDEELEIIIQKGSQAKEFLNHSFVVNILNPVIENEIKIAEKDGDWRPGHKPDINELAMVNCFNSGKKQGLRIVKSIVERLMSEAKEASQELENRKPKEEGEK